MVSDLDFTNCKALLAELLRILLADVGCNLTGLFRWYFRGENRGFKANTLVIYIHYLAKLFVTLIGKRLQKFY